MTSVKKITAAAIVAGGFIAGYGAHQRGAHADEKHPRTSVTISDLAKKKGPKPPSAASFTGVEAHPMVGDMELPIKDTPVYQFTVTTQNGQNVPVKWSYSPGAGTYLWATAPITCEDDKTIARGSFVMKIQDDGTGSYALGTKQCPMARIYGCNFDSQQKETRCGACVWNGTDLSCAHD